MSAADQKIEKLFERLQDDEKKRMPQLPLNRTRNRPTILNNGQIRRPQELHFIPKTTTNESPDHNDRKLREIMKNSGKLKINNVIYHTQPEQMEHMQELGNGTCGHVVKMRHVPSGEVIAVKQMRRTGNIEENKRIVMDIEVVIKSHGCPYIVQCLGCFITESEVWICMELMSTCFDKLLKTLKRPVPEPILGKVTVATVKALSYLKDVHDIMHRDVKPSNILLDLKGNIKLCDFGISGRLVDSMAATKSTGCTAYLAPERIEIDPSSPDYDIRADVWSLGITLVELATGTFPYSDCKTDFEVLTKVIQEEPPKLPVDQNFSPEFQSFVSRCLIKDKKKRPKYVLLKNELFYKKYETVEVDVGAWFRSATEEVEEHFKRQIGASVRDTPSQLKRFMDLPNKATTNDLNGGGDYVKSTTTAGTHQSRLMTFQREASLEARRTTTTTAPPREYSPLPPPHLLGGHHHHTPERRVHCISPLIRRRAEMFSNGGNNGSSTTTPTSSLSAQRDRFNSPESSLSPLRRSQTPDSSTLYAGNTSPIVLQRFYHQKKQHQQQKDAEELLRNDPNLPKKKIASYVKLQFNGEKCVVGGGGRTSSRHQSPDPPPRLCNRGGGLPDSPLTVRRNFFESNNAHTSPSMSRRYVSPSPPMPPPRRLSESTSMPGSPQHTVLQMHFHYTPQLQRRQHHKDVS